MLRLKKAIFISDTKREKRFIELLNPVINSNSVWKTQSLKFLGDFYFSLNNLKRQNNIIQYCFKTIIRIFQNEIHKQKD